LQHCDIATTSLLRLFAYNTCDNSSMSNFDSLHYNEIFFTFNKHCKGKMRKTKKVDFVFGEMKERNATKTYKKKNDVKKLLWTQKEKVKKKNLGKTIC